MTRDAPLTVSMRDGRTLCYAVYGDPAGWPVIHLHGVPGCRLERYPDLRLTTALGARLITFDRPGYGQSSPQPGRGLAECAEDVRELADHLGLGRFALQASSAGTAFVLASAAALAGRVVAVAVLAGLGPIDRPGAFDGMAAHNVRVLEAALRHPDQLAAVLADDDDPALPKPERTALGTVPGLARMFAGMLPEITKQGFTGVLADYQALAGPWPAGLGGVGVPVGLWHGEADTYVPIHHGEYLAGLLPGAHLHRCPGEGHLAMFSHQREVFGFLASGFPGAAGHGSASA